MTLVRTRSSQGYFYHRYYCVIGRLFPSTSTSTSTPFSTNTNIPQSRILSKHTYTNISTNTNITLFSRQVSNSTYTPPSRHTTTTIASTSTPSTSTTKSTMSDDAYASFLEKANQDLSSPATATTTQAHESFHITKTIDEAEQNRIPPPLRGIDDYYMSETDEVFEPVALRWKGGDDKFPTEDEFHSLIFPPSSSAAGTKHDVKIRKVTTGFDRSGQYGKVIGRVIEAIGEKKEGYGDGDGEDIRKKADEVLRVYRVQHGDTRVEYWVVGVEEGGREKRILGVKAKAVES